MSTQKSSLTRGLVKIACILILVVGSGLALSGLTGEHGIRDFEGGIPALAMMLATVAFVTFFGFLSLPTDGEDVRKLTEPRMRLALTAALVLTYLVYFSVAAWRAEVKTTAELPMDLLQTLTTMIMVVLPFYFGVTGAVEIARSLSHTPGRAKQDSGDTPTAE